MTKPFRTVPTPADLRSRVPRDTDLSYIAEDLRLLAIPAKSLLTDPRNARKHPERNLEAVKASLRQYGQRKPAVVNSRTMIVEAGNGALEAARALGWEYLAVVFSEDDAITASGYGLADNRSAELAEWDDGVLSGLLRDLRQEEVNLGGLGWDDGELGALLLDASGDACGGGGGESESEEPLLGRDESGDISERWDVLVVCRTEQEQLELIERMTEEGRECRALIS